MGKGQMTVSLSGRIYDSNNTVEVTGSLSEMEGSELNPILEKNAFIYVTSGRINEMKFAFTADNNKADGRMTMRYHGLDITIKNKLTDDTTALKERFISFIANRRVLDSNPLKDEDVREGIIAYKRDNERFFFHYFFQAILTGIRSSIATNQNNRNR